MCLIASDGLSSLKNVLISFEKLHGVSVHNLLSWWTSGIIVQSEKDSFFFILQFAIWSACDFIWILEEYISF